MRPNYILLPVLLLATLFSAQAQDPQFTQFYAAPLYLNPAFAGSAMAPRITVNYRNQWPAITNYVTSAVGVDHFLPKINSGIGLLILNDSQGQGVINSTEVHGLYSFQFQANEQTFVRLGVQAGYVSRNLNYYGLTFGDQFTNGGYTGQPSNDPILGVNTPKNSYLDFSTGGLVYSDWFFAGFSAHHINQPSQGFFQGANSKLPIKGDVMMGLKIPLLGFTGLGDELGKEISISPVLLYKFQGKYDQLDIGAYLTYSPLTLGVYYRGLPFKQSVQGLNNHDALAFLVGYRQDKFSIGYSYDATVSTLGVSTGGSHEISLSYIFDKPEGKQARIKQRKGELSCPKF